MYRHTNKYIYTLFPPRPAEFRPAGMPGAGGGRFPRSAAAPRRRQKGKVTASAAKTKPGCSAARPGCEGRPAEVAVRIPGPAPPLPAPAGQTDRAARGDRGRRARPGMPPRSAQTSLLITAEPRSGERSRGTHPHSPRQLFPARRSRRSPHSAEKLVGAPAQRGIPAPAGTSPGASGKCRLPGPAAGARIPSLSPPLAELGDSPCGIRRLSAN